MSTAKSTAPIQEPDGNVRDPKTGRYLRGSPQETNKNGKGGAPRKHNPEDYAQALIDHFKVDFSRSEVKSTTRGKNDYYREDVTTVANYLPQIEGFARKFGINADMLVSWASAKQADGVTPRWPEFSAAYKLAKNLQQEMLIANGLNGYYNPIFAKFVAQNFTDLRDKQAIDHTTLGKAMPAPQVYLPEDLPEDFFKKDEG